MWRNSVYLTFPSLCKKNSLWSGPRSHFFRPLLHADHFLSTVKKGLHGKLIRQFVKYICIGFRFMAPVTLATRAFLTQSLGNGCRACVCDWMASFSPCVCWEQFCLNSTEHIHCIGCCWQITGLWLYPVWWQFWRIYNGLLRWTGLWLKGRAPK